MEEMARELIAWAVAAAAAIGLAVWAKPASSKESTGSDMPSNPGGTSDERWAAGLQAKQIGDRMSVKTGMNGLGDFLRVVGWTEANWNPRAGKTNGNAAIGMYGQRPKYALVGKSKGGPFEDHVWQTNPDLVRDPRVAAATLHQYLQRSRSHDSTPSDVTYQDLRAAMAFPGLIDEDEDDAQDGGDTKEDQRRNDALRRMGNAINKWKLPPIMNKRAWPTGYRKLSWDESMLAAGIPADRIQAVYQGQYP